MVLSYQTRRRGSSTNSDYSALSDYSQSTAPTDYSEKYLGHYAQVTESKDYYEEPEDYFAEDCRDESGFSRASFDTYASTVASEEDFVDEQTFYDEPEDYQPEAITPVAVASSPPEFAEYFPSTRRLCIQHDDTIDGNMNLRLDTEVQMENSRRMDLTLFHLRMHDLKDRQFSLRRYCRDSGREVCHSSRKYAKPAERRPGFSRSMSNALASLRPKSESKASALGGIKRQDSGYESMSEDEESTPRKASLGPPRSSRANVPMPTNTTKLEFSNYAHIDVKRRGTRASKHYDFEYWGTNYSWRRDVRKIGSHKEISYHLIDGCTNSAVAHIVPIPMTPIEQYDEQQKGGWIAPCSMWISDERILSGLTDVADVVVATGLITLVDDSIKNTWHRKDRFQFPTPMTKSTSRKLGIDYVGPKKLIDEMFHRRSHTSNSITSNDRRTTTSNHRHALRPLTATT